jgi:hypothetical protein
MAHRPLPTVTPLPVLIKSSAHATLDGAGTVFEHGTEITGLHVVSKEEVLEHLDQWKRSHPKLWQLVGGVAALQRAQSERDWRLFQSALDLVQQKVPHFWGRSEIEHVRDSESWKDAGWTYSGLVSNLLQTARFIIWYSAKEKGLLRPGLYCPSWEVAVYAVVAMEYIRFCKKPGCGEPFVPRHVSPGADNEQRYCTPAHANAERVARAKSRKRAAEQEQRRVEKRRQTGRSSR